MACRRPPDADYVTGVRAKTRHAARRAVPRRLDDDNQPHSYHCNKYVSLESLKLFLISLNFWEIAQNQIISLLFETRKKMSLLVYFYFVITLGNCNIYTILNNLK